MRYSAPIRAGVMFLTMTALLGAVDVGVSPTPYAGWSNSFPADENFFPLAVWLQQPSNATAFKNLGINTYVGLWDGPTEAQLSALKTAGIYTVCDQNSLALASPSRSTIKSWMQGDEPDNAQPDGSGGYGPPITPTAIQSQYAAMKSGDATRPVLLNLGQGVAWDGWYGRGTRTNHPEDYPEYMKGGDIVSFDIYPVTSTDAAIKGNLWYVGQGVERLVTWSAGQKVIWNALECTHINSTVLPTPAQIRSEAWMSIIHGSRGLVWFVHEWVPTFVEAGLLQYPANMDAVKSVNAQIKSLAAVLNGPTITGELTAHTSNSGVPLKTMMKRRGTDTYVFVVAMRDGTTSGTFTLSGLTGTQSAEVLGESRSVTVTAGAFSDTFTGYGVHLYKIPAVAGGGGGSGGGGGGGGSSSGSGSTGGNGGGGGGGGCGLTGLESLAVLGLLLARRRSVRRS